MNFEGALGYGVWPGVALALEGGIIGQPDVQKSDPLPPDKDTYGLVLLRAGAMVDGYVTPSVHVQAGVDWVRGSWSRLAWLPDETPTGWLVHASGGLVWRLYGYDLGPSLRVYRASFTSDHSEGSVFGVLGVINAVWF
jgi:hypothetical protein